MKKSRKPSSKIKSQSKVKPQRLAKSYDIQVLPFHIGYPLTLHHISENKFCYFSCEDHMKKYIERCKLKPKDFKVTQTQPKKDD